MKLNKEEKERLKILLLKRRQEICRETSKNMQDAWNLKLELKAIEKRQAKLDDEDKRLNELLDKLSE